MSKLRRVDSKSNIKQCRGTPDSLARGTNLRPFPQLFSMVGFLCWNCQRIENKAACRRLKKLLRIHNSQIIALYEAITDLTLMVHYKRRFNCEGYVVDIKAKYGYYGSVD